MLGCDNREVLPYTGRGIYVGVLDSGVAAHPDLRGRIAAFKDFTLDKSMMIMGTEHMLRV